MKIRDIPLFVFEDGINPAMAQKFLGHVSCRRISLPYPRVNIKVHQDGKLVIEACGRQAALKGKLWVENNLGQGVEANQRFLGLVVRSHDTFSFLALRPMFDRPRELLEGLLRHSSDNAPKVGDLLAVTISEIDSMNRIILQITPRESG
ncbi:MAG: hypothetical protein WCX71_05180 [Candidatus Buchananbacteria bacterium]